jgi:large subunit ribosomal protein L21
MYAVVATGGKQVRVSPGDSVRVELLEGEVGDAVRLDQVLLVGGEGEARVGAPHVDGAAVVGTIQSHGRGPKIKVFKMKRRTGYRRHQGHRQGYTEVLVDKIEG